MSVWIIALLFLFSAVCAFQAGKEFGEAKAWEEITRDLEEIDREMREWHHRLRERLEKSDRE